MQKYTKRDIWLRGFLTVSVAGLGFLATNDTWISIVGKIGLMLTGLILVLLQAWRGWLDKSSSQGEGKGESADDPVSVVVENGPKNPAVTKEVPAVETPAVDADETTPGGELEPQQ